MLRLKDLKFNRCFDFNDIPRDLFEQLKDRSSDEIDRIYKYGFIFATSPFTLLYTLVDKDNNVQGVLWASINIVEAVLFVVTLSVYKEYQSFDGNTLMKVMDFLRNLSIKEDIRPQKICFFSKHSDISSDHEKIHLKHSDKILMEIPYEPINDYVKV